MFSVRDLVADTLTTHEKLHILDLYHLLGQCPPEAKVAPKRLACGKVEHLLVVQVDDDLLATHQDLKVLRRAVCRGRQELLAKFLAKSVPSHAVWPPANPDCLSSVISCTVARIVGGHFLTSEHESTVRRQ
eukprot:2557082-Prymnesium_polylepis.1